MLGHSPQNALDPSPNLFPFQCISNYYSKFYGVVSKSENKCQNIKTSWNSIDIQVGLEYCQIIPRLGGKSKSLISWKRFKGGNCESYLPWCLKVYFKGGCARRFKPPVSDFCIVITAADVLDGEPLLLWSFWYVSDFCGTFRSKVMSISK